LRGREEQGDGPGMQSDCWQVYEQSSATAAIAFIHVCTRVDDDGLRAVLSWKPRSFLASLLAQPHPSRLSHDSALRSPIVIKSSSYLLVLTFSSFENDRKHRLWLWNVASLSGMQFHTREVAQHARRDHAMPTAAKTQYKIICHTAE
jgi:hypothetical protein